VLECTLTLLSFLVWVAVAAAAAAAVARVRFMALLVAGEEGVYGCALCCVAVPPESLAAALAALGLRSAAFLLVFVLRGFDFTGAVVGAGQLRGLRQGFLGGSSCGCCVYV
jgi:hypothetical protein